MRFFGVQFAEFELVGNAEEFFAINHSVRDWGLGSVRDWGLGIGNQGMKKPLLYGGG